MAAVEEGSKCVVTAGRREGEEVEVVKVIDDNFVMVKGKKERKASVKHLRPL
ncbi:hypothetical protein GF318_04205 [Candidatus Micrarchaeota archaeon]|nr:hypothetical protein [Candidatus Micrarchaeota archaeon]